MKAMEAIKGGFDLASKNIKLVLLVFIFNFIWNMSVIPFTPDAPEVGGMGVAMTPGLTVLSLFFILASIFVQGGVLNSVKDIVKEKKFEMSKFAGYGARFYVRLLSVALIIVLIVGLIGFAAMVIAASSAGTGNAVLVAIGTIATIILVLLGAGVILHLFLTPYILVLEDAKVLQAMRASIDFVKKFMLKVLGLGALLILIGFGVGLIMGVLTGIASIVIKGKLLQVLSGTVNGGVNAYLSIVIASTLVIYYLAMKSTEAKEA